MSQIKHIAIKEFKDYFVSPIAYIVISIFLLVTGWLFFSSFFLYGQANLRNFFNLLPIVFAFVIPAVTMKQFAEEIRSGSYELLLTMPVTKRDVILGKFFACLAFIAALLIPTFAYPVTILFMGQLDMGPVIGGYLGALCLAGSFIAIGLFSSVLTKNQIVSFIIGMSICFTLTIINKMLIFIPESVLGFFNFLSIDHHFSNISKGIIDTRDILYFISVIFIGLYATGLAMGEKK